MVHPRDGWAVLIHTQPREDGIIMARYATHKTGHEGKAETLRRREVRRLKGTSTR
jgi:hypothetical protein